MRKLKWWENVCQGYSSTPSTCGCNNIKYPQTLEGMNSYMKDIQQTVIDQDDLEHDIVITIRIEKNGELNEEITITV